MGLLEGIIAHRKLNNAISPENGWYQNNGIKKRIVTTKGWEMRIKWKGGSTSWIPLKEIKASNSLEVAEYAILKGIEKEPAFAWCQTLMKGDMMISCLRN